MILAPILLFVSYFELYGSNKAGSHKIKIKVRMNEIDFAVLACLIRSFSNFNIVLDKMGYQANIFSYHMLWIIIKSASPRRF